MVIHSFREEFGGAIEQLEQAFKENEGNHENKSTGYVINNLAVYGNSALPKKLMENFTPKEVMLLIYIASGDLRYKCNVYERDGMWFAEL